jgi:hypothetical protein
MENIYWKQPSSLAQILEQTLEPSLSLHSGQYPRTHPTSWTQLLLILMYKSDKIPRLLSRYILILSIHLLLFLTLVCYVFYERNCGTLFSVSPLTQNTNDTNFLKSALSIINYSTNVHDWPCNERSPTPKFLKSTPKILHSPQIFKGSFETVCECKTFQNREINCTDHVAGLVKHCSTSHFHLFEIFPNSRHIEAFLRINGPNLDTKIFQRSSRNTSIWASQFNACHLGFHTASVYIYLQDTDENDVVEGRSCPELKDPVTISWNSSARTAVCEALWSWSKNNVAFEFSRYLSHPIRKDYVSSFSALTSSVPVTNLSDLVLPDLVCLFGDSQMRNLYNSILKQLGHPCDAEKQQQSKGECKGPGFLFKRMNYPSAWHFDDFFSNCSHVLVNFGQWPASTSRPRPWNRTFYSANVKAFISRLLLLKSKYVHVNISWVSTNPHPISFWGPVWGNHCPLHDWRLPHVISAYNLVAHDVISDTGGLVSYVDTFSIAFPAFDLTFDGAHYQGPVGVALAHLLLQSLNRKQNRES